MTNYVYIENLFKGLLSFSKAIEGRFYIGNRYGLQEVNYDQLGEVLKEVNPSKKYPLVVMAPPHSTVKFSGRDEGWEEFRVIMYFCKTTYYGGDQVLNAKTATSQHTITQDWHDMKRSAINFMKALVELQRNQFPPVFQVPTHLALIIPFSNVGADRVSGVKLDFDFKLFVGCETEDYEEYPTTINIEADGHAEHKL